MLNTKIYKQDFDSNLYERCAAWCNANNATIVDRGEYYECVAIPAPALSVIKENKIAELKNARDTEELSPIEYGGFMWDFDEKAQMRINGAITVLGDNTITWTSADNEEIKKVTANDLKGVISASAVRSNQLHVKYRRLRENVENATSVEKVEEIVW